MLVIKRRAFANFLAVPQELRSEFARKVIADTGTRSLTTISQRPLRLSRCSAAIQTPFQLNQCRFQSSVLPIRHSSSASPQSTPATPTNPEKPPKPSRLYRIFTASALILIFYAAGFAMAAAPVAEAVNGFVNPPSDEETLSMYIPVTTTAQEVNEHIVNHPLAVKLRQEGNMTEARPHLKIPPAMRPHNLTAGTLLGAKMIEVPPLTFNEKNAELPKLVQFSYLGQGLCGHPGIVHGGLLATMLDEGLARCCFPALPHKVGVTASLKIDYRKPCPGDSYVVLKAETTKVEGRKAWVKGWIELLSEQDGTGEKLVEAEALFIEPKHAASMARIYSTS